MRAGLGIGESMMMPGEVVAASGCNGLQLMVGEAVAEAQAGCLQSVMEDIVQIAHPAHPEDLFEAAVIGH